MILSYSEWLDHLGTYLFILEYLCDISEMLYLLLHRISSFLVSVNDLLFLLVGWLEQQDGEV